MADPTIQTFCCYTTNFTETTLNIMGAFDSEFYNNICIFSSVLGILGATYQVLPRKEYSRSHRWISFPALRGRKIIFWLAVSDLLASLGVLIRSSLWLNYRNIMPATSSGASVIFCVLSSAWIQYFYTATWIWTLCYAIDMRFILSEKEERISYYHLTAWSIPAVLTSVGLSLLYFPDINCHNAKSLTDTIIRILPNYVVTYIPIAIVMIANPWLYVRSCRDMENIITCHSGQFTSKERDIIDSIKIKFGAINCVFYICWITNLVNGILLWSLWSQLPVMVVVTTWYIMAFTNPLQAVFNCLVYRRWNGELETIAIPWSRGCLCNAETVVEESSTYSYKESSEERLPLLYNYSKASINKPTDTI